MNTFQAEKSKLLTNILRLLMAIGLIAYIPSVLASIYEKLWVLIFFNTLTYILVAVASLHEGLSYRIKCWVLVGISLVLGVVVLIYTGAQGAGYIWIITGIFIAAIFGSLNLLILSIVVSFFAMSLYAYLIFKGFPNHGFSPVSVIIIACNILVISITLSYVVRSILKSLFTSFGTQVQLSKRLEEELLGVNIVRDALTKALLEKETLLQEVNHRVNNNMQMILSLIALDGGGPLMGPTISRRIRALSAANEVIHLDTDTVGANLADIVQAIIGMEGDYEIEAGSGNAFPKYVNETEFYWFLKPQDAIIAALCIEEVLNFLEGFRFPLCILLKESDGIPVIYISMAVGNLMQEMPGLDVIVKKGPIMNAADVMFFIEGIPMNKQYGPGIAIRGLKAYFI